jgi:excisionase family DNA binding protein
MGEPAKMMIVVTPAELETLVRKAVRAELGAVKTLSDDDRLLTTQQAAAALGISKRTLLWHVAQGRLVPDSPAREGFKVHRFKRSTLEAFMLAAK